VNRGHRVAAWVLLVRDEFPADGITVGGKLIDPIWADASAAARADLHDNIEKWLRGRISMMKPLRMALAARQRMALGMSG
jgi:hypothetical protein